MNFHPSKETHFSLFYNAFPSFVCVLFFTACLLSSRCASRGPLGFTLRMLLALTIAALPGIVWHPSGRVLLGVSGVVYLVLAIGLLLLVKPLNPKDLEMVGEANRWAVRHL